MTAIIRADDMTARTPLAGWTARFFHSPHITFGLWDVGADARDLHQHHHEQEEVWTITSGSTVLVLDGVEHELQAGDAAVVPPNTPHAIRIVGAFTAVVADYPLREALPGGG